MKQADDALTFDVDFFSNVDYFIEIMKLVDDEFLQREYKLTKEANLGGSLLYNTHFNHSNIYEDT